MLSAGKQPIRVHARSVGNPLAERGQRLVADLSLTLEE